MLLLKEKELNKEAEEDVYLNGPKKRVMPSRANYYANVMEKNRVPLKNEEYSIELIRGGRTIDNAIALEDLDVNNSALTETDSKQYEKLPSELMPSSTTMRSLSVHRNLENIESSEEVVDFKVNKKGLLMLMIYAVIIIAIFAFIIVNAVSLVNLMNSTASLEQRLAQENSSLESLNEKINEASDPNLLYNKAVNELGMVEKSPSGTITLPITAPEAEDSSEGSTNIYDWVLDNVFGNGL